MAITYRRTRIRDFELANTALVGTIVTFYNVDPVTFLKLGTLATLYTALSGAGLASNPQTLDSEGKFENPVYHEDLIIATVGTAPQFDTGVVFPLPELIYDHSIQVTGKPLADERIWKHRFVRKVEFPAGFTGSQGFAFTVATGVTVFDVKQSTPPGAASIIGTVTFGAGATTPSFALAALATFEIADVLEVVAPNTRDDTLADFTMTLRGTRV